MLMVQPKGGFVDKYDIYSMVPTHTIDLPVFKNFAPDNDSYRILRIDPYYW